MSEPSVYTRIIKGELPCHKVYEDEYTFAFMDIHPIQPGHVLVVSKRQVPNFYELDDAEYDAFMRAVRKVAKRLKEVFPQKKRIGVMLEGLEVDHVHAKIFPVDTGDQFRSLPDPSVEPDHAALAELAKKIAF